MWLTADTTPATSAGTTVGWINYGVLGLLVSGIIFGVFWAKPGVDHLKEEVNRAILERDKAQAQRDALAETFQKDFLPFLMQFKTTAEALLRFAERAGGGDDAAGHNRRSDQSSDQRNAPPDGGAFGGLRADRGEGGGVG